jgi:hypothetical protein
MVVKCIPDLGEISVSERCDIGPQNFRAHRGTQFAYLHFFAPVHAKW